MSVKQASITPCDCTSRCDADAAAPCGNDAAPTAGRNDLRRTSAVTAATTAGFAASACVACCVAPILWPAVFAGVSSSVFAWIERGQRMLALASAAVVVLSWAYLAWVRSRRGQRTGVLELLLLGGATVLAAVAVFWARIEPLVLRLID